MSQTRLDSMMESVTNVVIGLAISTPLNAVVLPAVLNVRLSAGQNITISVIFTIVSIMRSYALRRIFNGRSVWAAIKGAVK